VPLSSADEAALDEIRVSGAEGQASRVASRAIPHIGAARVTMARRTGLSSGSVSAGCDSSYARGVLVLDARTGVALGAASSAAASVVAAPGRELTVLCSDGVRTSAARAVAP
jgi:hypothetical protein